MLSCNERGQHVSGASTVLSCSGRASTVLSCSDKDQHCVEL